MNKYVWKDAFKINKYGDNLEYSICERLTNDNVNIEEFLDFENVSATSNHHFFRKIKIKNQLSQAMLIKTTIRMTHNLAFD